MGLWDRVGSLFTRKKDFGPLSINDAISFPLYNQPPKRGTRELIQAWKKIPALRAVTGVISTGVAQVPWRVFVRSAVPGPSKTWRWGVDRAVHDSILRNGTPDMRRKQIRALATEGTLRELTDHPLIDFLNEPNARHTGLAAQKLLQDYLELKGEAFLAIERNAAGMPIGWYPMPPHWVIDVPNRALPDSFRVSYGTIQGLVPATEMIWLRNLDPENPYGRGTGVGEALGDELETDEYAAKMTKAWFYNTGMPAFLASLEGATETSLKALKERWDQEHRSFSNYGRGYFTDKKLSIARLDTSFRDIQLTQLRKEYREIIRQTFGVPPEILGIIENSNRATIQSAFFLFAQNVLVPRLEFLRTEYQCRLVPEFDDRLILDYESPVPEDKEFSLKVATVLPGAFSLNEWRAFANHEPVAEFNGKFPPLSMPGQAPGEQVVPSDGAAPAAGASSPQEPKPNDETGKVEQDPDDYEAGKSVGDPPWALALR